MGLVCPSIALNHAHLQHQGVLALYHALALHVPQPEASFHLQPLCFCNAGSPSLAPRIHVHERPSHMITGCVHALLIRSTCVDALQALA
jgi:hypothetical protein